VVHGDEADSPQPGGVVLAQHPKRGQRLEKGSVVRLTVSSSRATVPDVFSLDEAAARAALARRGLINVTVTPDSVYQAVASLRRLLGDDSKQPTYIATAPRLGYRMVATVGPWTSPRPDDSMERARGRGSYRSEPDGRSRPGHEDEPGANQTLVRGDTVTITASSGPKLVTIPSTVLDDRDDAVSQLEDDGLRWSPRHRRRARDGTVLAQTPPGGRPSRAPPSPSPWA
jgi:beta-lactam-binding protein with PASTA domain